MSDTRDIRKQIRFSESEMNEIREGVANSYTDTFSAFVRNAAIQAAKEAKRRDDHVDKTTD